MAKRKSLTTAAVERLTYDPDGPSRQVLWDNEVRGFGCRVTPAGGKQYVLLYRFNGRKKLHSLGPIGDFTNLAEARKKAEALRHGLRHDNVDPARARESMSETATVRDIWLNEYTKNKLDLLSENSRRTIKSVWTVHLEPRLGDLKPQQVTSADLLRLHDEVTRGKIRKPQTGQLRSPRNHARGGKVVANRAVERFGEFLNWHKERNKTKYPVGWENPAESVPLHKERPRKHHLDIAQLRALLKSLYDEPNPWSRAFLYVVLFTGARKSEVRNLTWSNVDLERRVARIDRTKNGDPMDLRLPIFVVAALKELPLVPNCEWVFPGRSHDEPMIEPRRAYRAALKRADLPLNTTFHDLRRSVGTSGAWLKFSEKTIARALNNTTEVASRVYIQLAESDVRDMVEAYAAALLAPPEASHGEK